MITHSFYKEITTCNKQKCIKFEDTICSIVLTKTNIVSMLREDLVDGDVDRLHVERSLYMMCRGFHLYSCYR
jgi:hypothetical protein